MAASSSSSAKAAASKVVGTNLGTSGIVFFGGLCVGTFGLGCWQLERLLEKWDAIEDREEQLHLSPIAYGGGGHRSSNPNAGVAMDRLLGDGERQRLQNQLDDHHHQHQPYRRRLLRGRFRHDKEVLIGPRGAPPGVQMPVSGLSAKKKKNNNKTTTTAASGMQPGPQGFYVYTPMEVAIGDSGGAGGASPSPSPSAIPEEEETVVWINRGWIPKTLVPGADRPHYKNDPVQRAKIEEALRVQARTPAWNRPRGTVEIEAVLSRPESE